VAGELWEAEQELSRCASGGVLCDLSGREPEARRLRAPVLYGICVSELTAVHSRGVRVRGAVVEGALDLSHTTLAAPLSFVDCTFEEPLRLDSMTVPALGFVGCTIPGDLPLGGTRVDGDLVLRGTRLGSLSAEGSEVRGNLCLDQGFRTTGPVLLDGSEIGGDLLLAGAELAGCDDEGRSLVAVGVHVGRSAMLHKGFRAAGAVMFANLTVDNMLTMVGARIDGVDGWGDSLNCIRARINGTAYLRDGFSCAGSVRFSMASIGGRLLMRSSEIGGGDQRQVGFAGGALHVAGDLSLEGARIAAVLVLERATIQGRLELTGAQVTGTNADGYSIEASGLHAVGHMAMTHGFATTGAVRLRGATLDGGLRMVAARIGGADYEGVALRGSALRVTGGTYLGDGFEAAGGIRCHHATFEGGLLLRDAKVTAADERGYAVDVRGSRLAGDLDLSRGFHGSGALELRNIHVDGELRITDARLLGVDDDQNSLHGTGIHVLGDARLNDLEAVGTIRLRNGVIDGNLGLEGAVLQGVNRRGAGLLLNGVRVGGNAYLSNGLEVTGGASLRNTTVAGRLDLRRARFASWLNLGGAHCAELLDDPDSWPAAGELTLRGFRFGVLADAYSWQRQTEWARRQGFVDWSPDPYEQLAGYYVSVGDEDAARRVRMTKGWDELTHLKTTRPAGSWRYRLWRRPFGWFAGFGYRRWPAAALLVLTVLAAGLVFRLAEHDRAMVPSDPVVADAGGQPVRCGDAYPCFNSWVYGADVVLPIIDFGQDGSWRPVDSRWWVWSRWAFIAAGWVLASVFVAAFTGLVQRE